MAISIHMSGYLRNEFNERLDVKRKKKDYALNLYIYARMRYCIYALSQLSLFAFLYFASLHIASLNFAAKESLIDVETPTRF